MTIKLKTVNNKGKKQNWFHKKKMMKITKNQNQRNMKKLLINRKWHSLD
jgi:hypothetical protein